MIAIGNSVMVILEREISTMIWCRPNVKSFKNMIIFDVVVGTLAENKSSIFSKVSRYTSADVILWASARVKTISQIIWSV